jgi:hypothetical protein
MLLSCASAPSTALSKKREITVPELEGKVIISAIQYAGESVYLSKTKYISVKDDNKKRIAILSIQIRNTKKNKVYELAPIVLLDENKKIFPDAVKYFNGNSDSGFASDIGIESRKNDSILDSLPMKAKCGGKYTVNLIYAIDVDRDITRAGIYGQVIEFNTKKVRLDVIGRFH